MERQAFIMKLNPGCKDEYKNRHDQIWPKLKEMLSSVGISDYSIYLDESTMTLFATLKLSENNRANTLSQQNIVKEWWAYMEDIMETNSDNSPIQNELIEVFHME